MWDGVFMEFGSSERSGSELELGSDMGGLVWIFWSLRECWMYEWVCGVLPLYGTSR